MEGDNFSFVPTRCSILKNTAVQYQEVVYKDLSKKNYNGNKLSLLDNKIVHDKTEELDMKKARYEIMKFAKKNSNMATRQQTDRELAIKLGAKAPNNKKCLNYKEMLARKQRKKARKEKKAEIRKIGEKFSCSLLNNKRKRKSKPKKKGISDSYGKPSKKLMKENGIKFK